ncbi:type III-A CRISPR-associated RAMP protein Csm4 [Staphylococcus pseudintermedius]|nr:type III-A CRISPR-associated RAMP protein Csm4 [Staphylococcus pseudintermedius]
MVMKIFKLHFHTAVHFGNKRLSDGEMTISADTLFSALFIENLQLGQSQEWLHNDLILSDTFPFVNDLLYLPKPLIKIESKEEGHHKDFKKIKYIPTYHYLQFVKGEFHAEDANDLNDIFNVGHYALETKVSLLAQSMNLEAESEPYSVGTFTFEEDAGLYFIAQGSEKTMDLLEKTLNALQFSGLGGKRNTGYGRFHFEVIEDSVMSKLLNQTGKQHILLTTAMATDEEIMKACNDARYLLKKRSGFIQSTTYEEQLVKKKDFYSFAAGSVFLTPFKGGIFDVGHKGNHPIFRYAKPLWLEV